MKKRLFALLLTLTMMLSVIAPLGVSANTASVISKRTPFISSEKSTYQNIKLNSYSAIYNGSYYSELNNDQKKLYDKMNSMPVQDNTLTITLETPITFTSAAQDATKSEEVKISDFVYPVMYAFLWDKPLVFWIDLSGGAGSSQFAYSGNRVYKSGAYHWTVNNIMFDVKVASMYKPNTANFISQASGKVSSFSPSHTNRYGILKDIHNYLCQNTVYDANATYAHEPYGALVDGNAVCEGYAEAFKLICDRLNIPCVLVVGDGVTNQGSEAHMWNYVQMEDSNWYAVDVTWDDQTVIYYDYFLCGYITTAHNFGSTLFNQTHIEDGKVASQYALEMDFPDIYSTAFVDPCKNGHTPSDWVITKAATYLEDGLREKRCTVCGELLAYEAIPKLVLPTGGKLKDTSTLKITDGYLTGIKAETTVAALMNEFDGTIVVLDSTGAALSSGSKVGTGCKVTVGTDLITIFINGEVNGDGVIDSVDCLILKKIILGNYTPTEAQLKAVCLSGEALPSAIDYLKIKKHVLGNLDLFA